MINIDTTAQGMLKNSIYNFIGYFVPIVVLVVFIPIIIQHLGVKQYGVYIFLNTTLTFLGLLELGAGTATNKHLIEYYSTGQKDKLKNLLYSMNSAYLIQGLCYIFTCLVLGFILQNFFFQGDGISYFKLFTIVGATGFVTTLFANFLNTTVALQRYRLHVSISTIFLIVSNTSMLVLAVLGYGLQTILIFQFFVSTLSALTYYFFIRKIFPILKFKYRWSRQELKKNYGFGLKLALNNIANSSLVHFDKLIIPFFLGSSALTYYSVPAAVPNKISSLSKTFSSLLFPIVVDLNAQNNTEKIERIYIRSVRLLTILSVSISLPIILFADKILFYWLDQTFVEQSFFVLIFLVLTNLIMAIYTPLFEILTAIGKVGFVAKGSIAMLVINLIALFILLPKFGINGAAMAYLLSVLFVFWMFGYAEKKYILQKNKSYYGKLLLKIASVSALTYFIIKGILYDRVDSIYILAIAFIICWILFIFLYYILGFAEKEDIADVKLFYKKMTLILKKEKYNEKIF